MEGFLDALGAVSLTALVLVGLIGGLIAGWLTGRNTVLYVIVGVVGAIALPFLLAAIGIGVVAAGGLLLLLVVSAIGALALIAVYRLLFGERR
jgi:uncharacterized membrane protein YeaQ/YmgE (transglycosylase-associated protein family)